MKVGFVSLGCSKNLVDTEKTIGIFKAEKYEIVNKPEEAEVIVINTCGFIEPAKEEAINTILEMAEYKKKKCKYLIVMGCLVERYKEELIKALPEVDLFIKYSEYNTLWEQITELLSANAICSSKKIDMSPEKESNTNVEGKIISTCKELNAKCKYYEFDKIEERVVSTGDNFAYLKIADGCSNRCTYCAIPYIRGTQMSRRMEDILKEAKKLVDDGYKELILIAQDTTKYGIDIYGKPKLAELLQKLCEIDGLHWIRFLYAYPETIDDELIKVVKENKKICKYFDIPIQHISNTVLKRMNRQSDGKSIRKLIQKLRNEIPEVVIRTTVMVGFPGETKEDFDELYAFLKEAKFDKLGCFAYSKEDGTPAARIKEQVHPMTKKSRYNKIMSLQQEISKENLQKQIGKKVEILVEDRAFDGRTYIGRTSFDVPEIDGVVYLIQAKEKTAASEQANTKADSEVEQNNLIQVGDFVQATVVDVSDYDLICELE